MIYLTGDNAHRAGAATLATLKTFLAAQLAAEPWATEFSGVGGVPITAKHVEAAEWQRSKRPFLFLSLDGGDHVRELWRVPVSVDADNRRGVRHLMNITVELCVPPASEPLVQKLRDALTDIFDRQRTALRDDLGLHQVQFSPGRDAENAAGHINPHSLECVVYSL